MFNKSKKIKIIFIIYWVFLFYIITALIWWCIALSIQNEQMSTLKIKSLSYSDVNYNIKYQSIIEEKKRKTGQYLGEGAIFFLLISAGAIFLFRAVNKQLKISQQQQNFMMAITHELKTPIAITKLNLETIQKRKLDDNQQLKLISNTIEENNRMNALCSNLLLSSQMEAGGYQLAFAEINFSELVLNCVRDFKNRFAFKAIQTEIEENIFLKGDIFLLQIVINNLIDNAVKYTPKESVLTITLSKGKFSTLCVADQGEGINDNEKKKVFDKFYRSGIEATQKSKGTGLGLFLVKKIIHAHKGDIYIKDNKPKGAQFFIELKS